MNRRGFIGSILAIGAAPAIVRASSLMRVQGIIVPTLEEVVAVNSGNSLLTFDLITREALRVMEKNLILGQRVNAQFDSSFKGNSATIRIRRPITYAR